MASNLSLISEAEILTLVRDGDTRAYGELYNRYLDEIYRYLYFRVARNQPEAEDLAQEVFLKGWKALTSGSRSRKKSNFRALLYRIAHNLAVDRWRTEKDEMSLEDGRPSIQASEDEMPEYQILTTEQNQELAAAIRELDPNLQDVFICRFINVLSHAETAQILGLKIGHVRVLQHRALKQIRITIKDPGGD